MSAPILENPDLIQSLKEPHRGTFDELAAIELISDDGFPMESGWHRKCMNLLIDQIDELYRGRNDYYVGGNMFIYFNIEQIKTRDFRGPDFFYVANSTRLPVRKTWTVWKERNHTPSVVIELTSPSTREEDLGEKLRVYRDELRVSDYFVYDPDSSELLGWRLEKRRYVPLEADAHGRLPCAELELSLGTWEGEFVTDVGTWLRFFDREGHVVPTPEEAANQRTDAAEAEIARLRDLLGKLQAGTQNGTANHS